MNFHVNSRQIPQSSSVSQSPLSGLRVIEFGQYIAIPAAGQTLRDLGAEVIKVETSGGDPARRVGWVRDDFGPMFASYNRGKQSVVLNLSSPEGKDMARRLALSGDVVLQNARPGAMQRAGLSAEQLRPLSPKLIVAAVSGYGLGSAFAQRSGLDIAAQAESGMMSLNGQADSEPTRVGYPLVDVMTSQMVVNAVLAALVRRGMSGQGASIDISLMDVATSSMAYLWADYALTGRMPMRQGNGQPTVAPAADVVATADGVVVISAFMDEHFLRLAQALGQPKLAEDVRFSTNAARVVNRKPMLAALKEAFSKRKTEELCETLGKLGIVIASVRNFDAVKSGANGVSPELFVKSVTPLNTSIVVPGLPFHIDGETQFPSTLPSIGEHTAQVLAQLDELGASSSNLS